MSALNHMPSDRLGGRSAVTGFTALPASTPLTGYVNPETKKFANVDLLNEELSENLRLSRLSLDEMHQEVAEVSAAR